MNTDERERRLTKPYKEHLRETLKTPDDYRGYLNACHAEGPETFALAVQDVLDFAATRMRDKCLKKVREVGRGWKAIGDKSHGSDEVHYYAKADATTSSPAAQPEQDDDILDDERVQKELGRWQEAIRNKLIELGAPDWKIDGAGCDSGNPLDFTLAEVGQGVGYFIDQLEELKKANQ